MEERRHHYGTVIIKDIYPAGDSKPGGSAVSGKRVFFAAHDGTNGRELWRMLPDLPNHLYLLAIVG